MKFRVCILLLLICNLAFSQTKNDFLVGGELGFRYTSDYSGIEGYNALSNEEYLLQVNPVAGYFITNYLAAGIGFEYLYDRTNYGNYVYYYSRENGFSITPFVRLIAPFGFFIQGEFDYGKSRSYLKGRPVSGATGYSVSSSRFFYNKVIGFAAGIGYTIKVNEVLGIEPSVKYLGIRFNEKDPKNDISRKGLIASIGMVYYIK